VERWFDARSLDGIEDHHAHHECGELGIAGLAEFFGVGIEQECFDVSLGGFRCLANQLPGWVLLPGRTHAGGLGPLAGKCERDGDGAHCRL
jgi:hypothetical protein